VPAHDGPATPGVQPAAVRDSVLRSIVQGTLRPGDALPVEVVVARTGASADTVRDALRQLTELGVAHADVDGVVIAHPTASNMAETDEVRHILEDVAVRRFVQQATETQVSALRRALEAVEEVAAQPGPSLEQLVRARDWFFVVMLRATGLATLDLLRSLRSHAGLVMSLAVAGPGRPREIAEELRAVYLALAARDAGAAIAACDRHRTNSTDAGLKQLGNAP
jgi:DNA-binding GntR family transcriptional regulator